jgi:hypothetical protein
MADFTAQQLASGKWGIYSGARLLATVGSQEICQTVMLNLSSGRKDVPANDVDALYQVPLLKNSSDSRTRLGNVQSSPQSRSIKGHTASSKSPKASLHKQRKTQNKSRNQPATGQSATQGHQKSPRKAQVDFASKSA